MEFNLDKALEILRQTPYSLERMLGGLSDEWIASNENREDWSPYDVIGHLINCEETNWIPRARIIVEQSNGLNFGSFDRFAQFEKANCKTLDDLLTEFAHVRNISLETLVRWQLTPEMLKLKGVHSDLGEVSLSQLLSTWVVHDLTHTRQIVTFMAKKYQIEVGPWREYLSILK